MTCKHGANDPECTSHPNHKEFVAVKRQMGSRTPIEPTTPDSKKFLIEEAVETNGHLILKVRYPNCAKCSYEGVKVLVFAGSTVKDALFWKTIDPHFREPTKVPGPRDIAPGPCARFPASAKGWAAALAFAGLRTIV